MIPRTTARGSFSSGMVEFSCAGADRLAGGEGYRGGGVRRMRCRYITARPSFVAGRNLKSLAGCVTLVSENVVVPPNSFADCTTPRASITSSSVLSTARSVGDACAGRNSIGDSSTGRSTSRSASEYVLVSTTTAAVGDGGGGAG